MHEVGDFEGILNERIVNFCKKECRKFYFSLTLIENLYGEK